MQISSIEKQLRICQEISLLGGKIALALGENSRIDKFDDISSNLFEIIIEELDIPSRFVTDDLTDKFVAYCDGKIDVYQVMKELRQVRKNLLSTNETMAGDI